MVDHCETIVKLADILGTEYTITGKYNGRLKEIAVYHSVCNKTYFPIPKNILAKKSSCGHCSGRITPTRTDVHATLDKMYSPKEYILLTTFTKLKDLVFVRHSCGYEYKVELTRLLHGRKCNNCFGNRLVTNDEFINSVLEMAGGEYTFLEPYINDSTKLRVMHNKCSTIYSVAPTDFKRGKRCPKCKFTERSKGEKIIYKVLDDLGIFYESEKSFNGLKGKHRKLRFDFFVPEYNLLIEFDGKQHFKEDHNPTAFHYNKFSEIQENDIKKNLYAKEKGYSLIRFNSKHLSILEELLNKLFTATVSSTTIKKKYIFFVSDELRINQKSYYTSVNKSYFS